MIPLPEYHAIRSLHVACAALSVTLFAARGAMQLSGVDWRRWRWLRIAPHLNDTLLLAAAITLAASSGQYPVAQPWLTAKVCGLIAYVATGRIALQAGTDPRTRRIAYAAALLIAAYIIAAAVTRSPLPGLS